MFVVVRFAPPQLMIEVQHGQSDPELLLQICKHSQHGHRIGAARHRHTNALARMEHPLFRDRAINAFR